MVTYSFFALLIAATAGILGVTILAGAAVAVAQLVLVTAWIAFMILILMGRREPVRQAYQPIRQPSGSPAGRRTGPD